MLAINGNEDLCHTDYNAMIFGLATLGRMLRDLFVLLGSEYPWNGIRSIAIGSTPFSNVGNPWNMLGMFRGRMPHEDTVRRRSPATPRDNYSRAMTLGDNASRAF
jgi:hypothetical protein